MQKDDPKAGTRPRRQRATKRELAQRDLRLIEKLAAGVTIEEIAASEGISCKWARERKAAILVERTIDRPHEFIQLQIRRLNEAMLVAYSSMSHGQREGGRSGDQSRARARPLSWLRRNLEPAELP